MRTHTVAALALSLTVAAAIPPKADACTAFSFTTSTGPLLAKGFDWITGEGWVVVNERGRARSLLFSGASDGKDGSWTARFASLSLTTIGPGFPVSGMNEEGLAIEALVDFNVRPATKPEPGTLTGLELVQYGLDRFATVQELADFAGRTRISQLAVGLHFFACDRSGDCAVLETGRDGTRVTRDLRPKALANHPYAVDLETANPSSWAGWLGLSRPIAGSSGGRFRIVGSALRTEPPKDGNGALALLERVVMPGRTQWQIVWNLGERTLLLRQREAGFGTSSLKLDELEKACSGAPRTMSIGRAARSSFAPWSEGDVGLAEQAMWRQVGRAGAQASRLAEVVAAATRSSRCQPAQ